MKYALTVAGFAFGWAAITGGFTLPNLLLGAVFGGIALYLFGSRAERPRALLRLRRVGSLSALFVYELFLSAYKVAALVVRPDMKAKIAPAIVAFPLRATSDAEITLLANMITLTPGTLSIDVSDDRRFLYVHALECRDRGELVQGIAEGFEARVIEVFE
jgi:multicomponent Na+:H+ antiporter subunit E